VDESTIRENVNVNIFPNRFEGSYATVAGKMRVSYESLKHYKNTYERIDGLGIDTQVSILSAIRVGKVSRVAMWRLLGSFKAFLNARLATMLHLTFPLT